MVQLYAISVQNQSQPNFAVMFTASLESTERLNDTGLSGFAFETFEDDLRRDFTTFTFLSIKTVFSTPCCNTAKAVLTELLLPAQLIY